MVFNFTLIAHNGINYEKGEITMIDSNYTETLYDVIQLLTSRKINSRSIYFLFYS